MPKRKKKYSPKNEAKKKVHENYTNPKDIPDVYAQLGGERSAWPKQLPSEDNDPNSAEPVESDDEKKESGGPKLG